MAKETYDIGENAANQVDDWEGEWSGDMYMGAKPKNTFKALRALMVYGKRDAWLLGLSLLFAAVGTLPVIAGPGILAQMTDLMAQGLTGTPDVGRVAQLGLILAVLYGISTAFGIGEGLLLTHVAQRLTYRLRRDIAEKINRLPLDFFDRTRTGDVLSRVTNDADIIGQALNQSLSQLVASLVMVVGAVVMMCITNWIMALSGIAATFIGMLLMGAILTRSQTYFTDQQNALGRLNAIVEETFAGHTVVRAYNGEANALQAFQDTNQALYTAARKAQFLSGLMMPLMTFIGNFGYVVVCIVGAVLAVRGQITFGTIVAFMVYIRLFTQPLSQMAQMASAMQATAAASERIFTLFDEPNMEDESSKTARLGQVRGDVSFHNVRFGYRSDAPIIHDFSASIRAGQKVAIVGPTGAGKTTLVNLLMRFYPLDGGSITIDGTPIDCVPREDVHAQFAMVLQDTWVFEGSVRDNIIYSMTDIDDDAVIRACQAVGIHHFITTLPNGYDTVLDENVTISAGQKQLLTIARAMIRNAPMLILDEATSSVDTRTEMLIQQAMARLLKGRTAFIIAHRLSTIKNADLILVLRDGDIIERGNHDSLLATGGFYAKLYESQFAVE